MPLCLHFASRTKNHEKLKSLNSISMSSPFYLRWFLLPCNCRFRDFFTFHSTKAWRFVGDGILPPSGSVVLLRFEPSHFSDLSALLLSRAFICFLPNCVLYLTWKFGNFVKTLKAKAASISLEYVMMTFRMVNKGSKHKDKISIKFKNTRHTSVFISLDSKWLHILRPAEIKYLVIRDTIKTLNKQHIQKSAGLFLIILQKVVDRWGHIIVTGLIGLQRCREVADISHIIDYNRCWLAIIYRRN